MSILDNRLCRQFEIESAGDYEDRLAIAGKLRFTLEQLAGGQLPKDSFNTQDLIKLAQSIIQGQRDSQGELSKGSWAVAEPFIELPPDETMDLVVFPTILCVALLSRMVDKELLSLNEELIQSLKSAFAFLGTFPFGGEGMDKIYQKNEMILLFGLGRVPELLLDHPEISRDFLQLFKDYKSEVTEKIKNRDVVGQFGEDYSAGYQLSLASLKSL